MDGQGFTATLINKRVFIKTNKEHKRIVYLTLIFYDHDDQETFELKTFNPTKAFTVNRKATIGWVYNIYGVHEYTESNKEYSSSDRYNSHRSWYIDPIGHEDTKCRIKTEKNIGHAISKYIKNDIAFNFVGKYIELVKGFDTRIIQGKAHVKGWYVVLEDDDGIKCMVSVWDTPRVADCKFHLFGASPGDRVFVPNCRSSWIPPHIKKERNHFTFTSLMQPLVNPKFIKFDH